MDLLLWFLVFVVIVFLVVWAVRYLGSAFNTPPQIMAVVYVLLVIIVVILLLQKFPKFGF